MKEASVIVVVNKKTESVQVFKVGRFSIIALFDITHVLSIAEDIVNSVVHRIVEETSHVVLIRTNVSRVTVETFTHLENASSLTKFGPKILRDFGNGVNADAVKAICVDHIFNPVFQFTSNV